MRSSNNLPPSRLARARRSRRRTSALLALGGGLLIIAALVIVSRLPSLQVRSVVVSGNEATTEEELRTVIDENLKGHYLFLIPKSNIFLYPRAAIENAITAAIARVATANVSSADLSTISVVIKERGPSALWCEGVVDLNDPVPDPCYFIDGDGLIYGKAPVFSGNVFLRFWGIHGGDPTGLRLMPLSEYRELSFLLNTLPKFSLEPTDVVFDNQNADVTVHLKGRARLLFSRTQGLGDVLLNLDSVLSSEPLEGKDSLTIDYIDLRFGNKIFYRVR